MAIKHKKRQKSKNESIDNILRNIEMSKTRHGPNSLKYMDENGVIYFSEIISNNNRENKRTKSDIKEPINEYDIVFELFRLRSDTIFQEFPTKKTTRQRKFLRKVKEITSFPSRCTKYDISYITQLEYKSISIWFQNNRQRGRQTGGETIVDDNYNISRETLIKLFLLCG